MPRYYFYFINIFFCSFLYSQNGADTLSKIYIDRLHKGSLLVRLESMDNKIQFLNKQIENPKCDQKCKNTNKDLLNTTLSDRDQFNSSFIQSFKSFFDFCPVYFYYDKDHDKLFKSGDKSVFINATLNRITHEKVITDNSLVLVKDQTPESGIDGWVLRTAMGASLHKAMPYIAENNIVTLWNRFIYSDHHQRNSDYMVRKFNARLHEFRYKKK